MVYKRYPRVTFTDGTTCSAGPDCVKHAGQPIAVTKEQKAVAKKLADERRQKKIEQEAIESLAKEDSIKNKRKFNVTFERSITFLCPDIVHEFDVEMNGISPDLVAAGTDKSYWWKCPKDHKYQARPSHRKDGSGCSYCSGKRVSLETSLLGCFPAVAALLDEERSGFTAATVAPGAAKKGWWHCETGDPTHDHDAYCYQKTGRNGNRPLEGCPYCSNHRLCASNSLLATHPQLAKELDSDKNFLTASEIITETNKKFFWKCDKGHSWLAAVSFRINPGTGCPLCVKWASSKAEEMLRDAFKQSSLVDFVDDAKLFINWRSKNHMLLDVIVKVKSTGQLVVIEYDSSYYHSKPGKRQVDEDKTVALLSANYHVVRIREGLSDLSVTDKRLLQIPYKVTPNYTKLHEVVTEIEEWIAEVVIP